MKANIVIILLATTVIIFGLKKFLQNQTVEEIKIVKKKIMDNQISNIKILISDLKKVGITNANLIKGILSTVGKESNFKVQEEKGYGNTSNDRIRSIFPSTTKILSEDQLSAIKKNNTVFFNLVYGGKFGNNKTTDGEKYRGRGANQLTFKDNYEHYGNLIGINLVDHPELLNDWSIASKILAQFFKEGLKHLNTKISSTYKISDIQNPENIKQATQIAVSINAGGKDKRGSETEAQALAFNQTINNLNLV